MLHAVRFSVVNVGFVKSTCIPGLQDKLKFLEIQMNLHWACQQPWQKKPLPENIAPST